MTGIVSQAYELAYVKSPIFLVDGIATLAGGVMPLIAITEATSLASNAAFGKLSLGLENFWANFWALPGTTLHDNEIGRYPFANQQIAANAIIAQPLHISMRMNTTPRNKGDLLTKIMTAAILKQALDKHNNSGGTYSILTPSYFYPGCIMRSMKDITSGDSKYQQTDWQIDFEQPILSLNPIGNPTLNALLTKMTQGLPIPTT